MAKVIHGIELLSDEERATIQKQAREEILKERRTKVRKELLEAFKLEMVAEENPAAEMVALSVNLPYMGGKKGNIYSCVTINGVRYYHGQTYSVSRAQYNSMIDIIQNAWRHEEAAFGARDPNAFIHERNPVFSANSPNFLTV
jgi:hypothetical protein